jgi:hypothetical protein
MSYLLQLKEKLEKTHEAMQKARSQRQLEQAKQANIEKLVCLCFIYNTISQLFIDFISSYTLNLNKNISIWMVSVPVKPVLCEFEDEMY